MRPRLAVLPLLLAATGATPSAQEPHHGFTTTMSPANARVAGAARVTPAGNTAVRTSALPAAAPVPMPGWPIQIGAHPIIAPVRGVVLADLDRDGSHEIIAASTDGNVHVWDFRGTPLAGWPRALIGLPQYAPAVGDLDGDGVPEVVQTTRGTTAGGMLYVLRADGTDVPGWPLTLRGNNVEYTPALADLDYDGKLEVIVGERVPPVGYLHVLRHDGTRFSGWPVQIDHVPAVSAAVADLDGDGSREIVYASYDSLYVFGSNGTLLPGWPVNVSARFGANFNYQSPALADLDGDGALEIVTACHGQGSGCYVFRRDGSLLPGWPQTFGGVWTYSAPAVCDLEADGQLEVVCGTAGGAAAGPQVHVWSAAGVQRTGFPTIGPGGAEGHFVVADIDGLPGKEIVFDSSLTDAALQGWLHAVDRFGNQVPGWPLRTAGFSYLNGSSVMDVDGDGKLELATLGRFGTTATVHLWKLDAPFAPAEVDWWTYRESNARTGHHGKGNRSVQVGTAARGGTFDAFLKGPRGAAGALFLGVRPGVAPFPPVGVFQLDVTAPLFVLFAGGLTSGQASVRIALPQDPALLRAELFLQGIDATAIGVLSLTDMRSLMIR